MLLEVRIAGDPPTSAFPWEQILAWAPHLFWAAVALTIFFIIGPSRIREAFSRATKVGFGGLEVEFKSEIEQAAKAKQIDLPTQLRDQLARRLDRLQHLIASARILWIDDHPGSNGIEIGMLHKLGATIDLASSDRHAEQRLESAIYDLVLSDMARGDDPHAGRKFLSQVTSATLSPPLIFYVGKPEALPAGAFGLTARPDELFHLILDALERRKS